MNQPSFDELELAVMCQLLEQYTPEQILNAMQDIAVDVQQSCYRRAMQIVPVDLETQLLDATAKWAGRVRAIRKLLDNAKEPTISPDVFAQVEPLFITPALVF